MDGIRNYHILKEGIIYDNIFTCWHLEMEITSSGFIIFEANMN
jgi:hypothetical protein